MLPEKRRPNQNTVRGAPRRLGSEVGLRRSELKALTREELTAQLRVSGICDSILLKLDKLKTAAAVRAMESDRD